MVHNRLHLVSLLHWSDHCGWLRYRYPTMSGIIRQRTPYLGINLILFPVDWPHNDIPSVPLQKVRSWNQRLSQAIWSQKSSQLKANDLLGSFITNVINDFHQTGTTWFNLYDCNSLRQASCRTLKFISFRYEMESNILWRFAPFHLLWNYRLSRE